MNHNELEMRNRIATLVESVRDDRTRSHELFNYVWTMMCVKRGLMRVVREISSNGSTQLLLEEVRSGQQRIVSRPRGIDADLEGLAVQALARILGEMRPDS